MIRDDERLLDFLKSYRTCPPPPAPELEDRILHEIAATPATLQRKTLIGATLLFLLSSVGVFFYTQRSGQPVLSAAEYEQLESSLIRSWDASTARSETVSSTFLFDPDHDPIQE